jgi:hypothetical protein
LVRGQRQGPASRAVFRLRGRDANAIGNGLYIRSIGAVHETHQTGEDCQFERESQWLAHLFSFSATRHEKHATESGKKG